MFHAKKRGRNEPYKGVFMQSVVVVGSQWGDEGKGKVVDYFAPQYDVVARFQGGPNAGHSLNFDGNKVVLNTIPSGIFQKQCINIIGNGVVIDPVLLRKEIEKIIDKNPDVESYSRRTGIHMAFKSDPSNIGDYSIQLRQDRTKTTDEVAADDEAVQVTMHL